MNMGFSQRIKRPGINRLNPFVDRSNPAFESTGNPALRPVLFNTIQLGYTIPQKLTASFGLDYTFLNNADLPVSTFDADRNVSLTTFTNSGKVKGLSSFVYLNYPFTDTWNASINANLIYFRIQGIANGQRTGQEMLTYYADLSTGYAVGKGWRLNGNLSIISRNPTGFQGTTNGFVMSALALNKSLIKNKLTLAATANNPFTRFRNNRSRTQGPDFYQESISQVYYRSVQVTVNYKVGGLKGNVKKSRKSIRNDDLSNKKEGM